MAGFDPITRIFFVWAERAQTDIARNKVRRRILESPLKKRIVSRDMGALCLHVHRVERLAGAHEKTVALGPAKADIGAHFRQQDHADALTAWREDVDAVVACANPAGAYPDIAVFIGANSVGLACAFAG